MPLAATPSTTHADCPRDCSAASCDACRQFLVACQALARGYGPVYGGRVVLELVRQALHQLESGRTGTSADTLRHILRCAGMIAESPPETRTGPARPGDVRPAPEPAA